jgi:hypothetical protein
MAQVTYQDTDKDIKSLRRQAFIAVKMTKSRMEAL